MIYCITSDISELGADIIETIEWKDENDFSWLVQRIEAGFFISYKGDKYFAPPHFFIELRFNSCMGDIAIDMKLKNTCQFFIKSTELDVFAKVRTTVKTNYTDEVWDEIHKMFVDRLQKNLSLLPTEILL